MPIDLHLHSTHSDGTLTPAELIAEAKRLGLTVALTDHNTTSGLADFMQEADRQGVTAVPGIEISSVSEGVELHVVGLFLPLAHSEAMENTMLAYHRLKEESNLALADALKQGGYPVDYEIIKSRANGATPNRAHFALALVEEGYVPTVQDAFKTLLGEGQGYYTPPKRLETTEAILLLRRYHAVPVLAHPLLSLTEDGLRRRLPALLEAGLLAMEVMHCTCTDPTTATAKAIADEFGLLYSGGSDFHGEVKPDVHMGVGSKSGTAPNIPHEYFEKLRDAAEGL